MSGAAYGLYTVQPCINNIIR